MILTSIYILAKIYTLSSKIISSDVESYHEFCTLFGFKQNKIKVLARVTSRTYNYLPYFRIYLERVTQNGVRNVGLPDHLIYCTRKVSCIKRGCDKRIKFCTFKHYIVNLF